mmetsp:Transcript_24558/g.22309  ORF Transcript_24558/g.22309 Transcript_24558/m.22309 type:complete len:92 (-) Transcript_24558:16-291(-)
MYTSLDIRVLPWYDERILNGFVTDFEDWTRDLKIKAYIMSIEGKIKQNDIRGRNFGFYNDIVFVIDLEDIKVCETRDIRRYKRRILKLKFH